MLIFPLNFLLTNKSVSLIVKFEGDTIFMSIFKANFVTVQYEYFNIKKTSLQLAKVARSIYIT